MATAMILIVLAIIGIWVGGIQYAIPIIGLVLIIQTLIMTIAYSFKCKRFQKRIADTPCTRNFEDPFELVEALQLFVRNEHEKTAAGIETAFLLYFYENPDKISVISEAFRNYYSGAEVHDSDITSLIDMERILDIQQQYFNIKCDGEILFHGIKTTRLNGEKIGYKKEALIREFDEYRAFYGKNIKQLWVGLLFITLLAIPIILYIASISNN